VDRKTVWIIVFLVGAYVVCQLIADVAATRFVKLAGVTMPAGTFIFALTFTLRDMIHKRLGREWARAAIVTAAGFNLFLSGYLWTMSKLAAPGWFGLADSWNAIFEVVPAIVLGSIGAELVSEFTDTEVYHFWRNRFTNWPQWTRVVASNLVSIPLDSFVFSVLAFALLPPLFGADAMGLWDAITRVTGGQILYKASVTLVSLPGIYMVKEQALLE